MQLEGTAGYEGQILAPVEALWPRAFLLPFGQKRVFLFFLPDPRGAGLQEAFKFLSVCPSQFLAALSSSRSPVVCPSVGRSVGPSVMFVKKRPLEYLVSE